MFRYYFSVVACLLYIFSYLFPIECAEQRGINYPSVSEETVFHEHEWIAHYFNDCDEDTSLDEMIEFLLVMRTSLINKGLEVPNLSSIFMIIRENLASNGIILPEEDLNTFLQFIEQKECCFLNSASCSKKPILLVKGTRNNPFRGNTRISWKLVWGGCQLLAGSLCMIIPHGPSQVF